ncbi:MAG: L,D-transpeptidase family protein [Nitrospirota bacterium]
MKAKANPSSIISVRGSVVDVRFDDRFLPTIYTVLRAGEKQEIFIEVLAQRDANTVRGIALTGEITERVYARSPGHFQFRARRSSFDLRRPANLHLHRRVQATRKPSLCHSKLMKPLMLILTVLSLSLGSPEHVEAMTKGQPVAAFTPIIKLGQYVWKPEVSPTGPVVIIVSLAEQKLYVYRNGVRIGRSTISSGKAGHRTPTGVFTILQKSVKHISTIYKGASMPYMERLTWGGVAIHAGNLPGYPAAHGCVRIPLDFARQLYTVTHNGTTVIVTDQKSAFGDISESGLLFGSSPIELTPPRGVIWRPEKAPAGPVSIILSGADHVAYVYRNGIEIGRAPIDGLPRVKGSYVYSALTKVDAEGRHAWFSTVSVGGRAPNIEKLVKKITVDPQFRIEVRRLICPGATLILTDAPVSESTRSPSGLNILTTADEP